MRTIEVNLYQFDELDEEAQECARDWFREGNLDYDWWDSVYEDAQRIGCKISGFDLGRSQECDLALDGCTMGEVAARIIDQHGKDCDTYKLAQAYYYDRHHYSGGHRLMDRDYFVQQLGECYRIMLEREYEWLNSDECVDDSIRCNEYEFTEKGDIA